MFRGKKNMGQKYAGLNVTSVQKYLNQTALLHEWDRETVTQRVFTVWLHLFYTLDKQMHMVWLEVVSYYDPKLRHFPVAVQCYHTAQSDFTPSA